MGVRPAWVQEERIRAHLDLIQSSDREKYDEIKHFKNVIMPDTVNFAQRTNSAPNFQPLPVYLHSGTILHQSKYFFFMTAESEGSGIFSVESSTAFSLEKQGLAWLAPSGNQESCWNNSRKK